MLWAKHGNSILISIEIKERASQSPISFKETRWTGWTDFNDGLEALLVTGSKLFCFVRLIDASFHIILGSWTGWFIVYQYTAMVMRSLQIPIVFICSLTSRKILKTCVQQCSKHVLDIPQPADLFSVHIYVWYPFSSPIFPLLPLLVFLSSFSCCCVAWARCFYVQFGIIPIRSLKCQAIATCNFKLSDVAAALKYFSRLTLSVLNDIRSEHCSISSSRHCHVSWKMMLVLLPPHDTDTNPST